jgi:formylglycine-generating enzyme required for sulfatase activity
MDRAQKQRSAIDDAVQSKQLHGLLPKVEEYLTLQSDDQDMQQLQTRLLARGKKNADQIAQIIENADDLRAECQFDKACKALEKIPNHLLTDDADELLQNCAALSAERQQALEALHRAASQQEFKNGLKSANEYRYLLEAEQLADGEFETRYQECQQALQDQQKAIAAGEGLRTLLRLLGLAGAGILAVGLLIGAGLWIRSLMLVNAVAEAVGKQQWDEALAIDQRCFPALVGRALSNIAGDPTAAIEDLELAATLPIRSRDSQGSEAVIAELNRQIAQKEAAIIRFSQISSLSKTVAELNQQKDAIADQINSFGNSDRRSLFLNSLKATAYATRATVHAGEGDLTAAERDIKEAASFGASGAVLEAATRAVSAEYLSLATAAVGRGDLTAAERDIKEATSLGASGAVLQAANNAVTASHLLRDSADKLSTGDLDGATADLIRVQELGADTVVVTPLKSQLVSGLTSRFERSLNGKSYQQAAADYELVFRLDAAAGRKLQPDIEKLPPTVLYQLPSSAWPAVVNSIGMQLKLLPGGTFTMGSNSGDDDETPHEVTLSQPCYMGVHEVTQSQYEQVMESNPSHFKGRSNPVEKVSWDDAVEFCRKLSSLRAEKSAGRVYRLPTEAEWEYACRAGTTTTYSYGDDETQLSEDAWFGDNSGDRKIDVEKIWIKEKRSFDTRLSANNCRPHTIGGKHPNGWGLYDMHGNVFEWCQDWGGDYPTHAVIDPTGPSSGSSRVYRGGSWRNEARYCRSAYHQSSAPGVRAGAIGFRVVLSPPVAATPFSASPADQDAEKTAAVLVPNADPPAVLSQLPGRFSVGKQAALIKYGGTVESEAAVNAGLKWLKKIQKRDGSWSFDRPGEGAEAGRLRSTDMGATSLALLCYLGAGHTHKAYGEYQKTVADGVKYLMENARQVRTSADICSDMRGDFQGNAGMYVQGLATICVCEASALEPSDIKLKRLARKAIRFIKKTQDKKGGGWRYEPGEEGDTSVVGWQVMALQSAKTGDIAVSRQTGYGVKKFLDSVQTHDGSRYGYLPNRDGTPSMTSVGLLCRMYMGWRRDQSALKDGVAYLTMMGPHSEDMYYNYYATQVIHHWGGQEWQKWNAVMRNQLVSRQITNGPAAGSWSPRDPHANSGGQIYETALCLLTLEIYYRYPPLYQQMVN